MNKLKYNILDSNIRFKFNNETVAILQSTNHKFGFDGSEFGKVVYYRTYSRQKKDGSQETWVDTVVRVIEGVFTIRKWWYSLHNLPWNEEGIQKIARNMAVAMIKMQWLPPGRGLWIMGTDYIYERGSFSLYNCSYTEINNLVEDTAWLMNALMCGCGVGFGTNKLDLTMHKPMGMETYFVPDSREGWVTSVSKLISSYIEKDSKELFFDYSLIRQYGEPIKGFGGTSSGPEPLKELHVRLKQYLDDYLYSRINDTLLIANIENAIGCCVSAGNIRRCLPGYYSVQMADSGWKKIYTILSGESVLVNGKHYEVKNVFDNGIQEVINIVTLKGIHTSTKNHRWLVHDITDNSVSYVEAQFLTKNHSFIKMIDNVTEEINIELTSILYIEQGGFHKVYDIEVDKVHSFIARNDNTLLESISHNSAELNMGSINDETFMNLKNYDVYPERANIGWMSNNTVRLENSEDFEKLPLIAKSVLQRGEPAVANMINIRKYGRIRMGELNYDKATGMNPCGKYLPLS